MHQLGPLVSAIIAAMIEDPLVQLLLRTEVLWLAITQCIVVALLKSSLPRHHLSMYTI